MIIFINIGQQTYIYPDEECPNEFAWYDTVVDKFVEVGGSQVWDCWSDFEDDYNYGAWRENDIERFRNLFPKDWQTLINKPSGGKGWE